MTRMVMMFAVAAAFLFGQEGPRGMEKHFPPEIVVPAIVLTGVGGGVVSLTASDLATLPQQALNTTDHGTPVAFQGVLLNDILAKVAQPAGDSYRSTAASYYLVVEARDGYKAVFSWAEIDPTFTDRKLYVVTRRDGNPLLEKDGPFELVAPGDKKNSRWVRQVKSLTIRSAN